MILTSTADTYAKEAVASANFGTLARLQLNGGTSGNDKQAFIWFPRDFLPAGALVLSATLRVRLSGAWSGSNDVDVRRVTTTWSEGKLNWNNRPTTTATHEATTNMSSGADKQVLDFNVTAIMQDVADGGPFQGFRLTLDQNVDRYLRSGEDPDVTMRPQLIITFSEGPHTPDQLSPDAAQVVSVDKPVLRWRFVDRAGDTSQASSQVQVHSTADFTTPDYDSGKVANDLSEWDLSLTAFGGISDGATKFWRVKVWDGSDIASEWSAAAEFKRDDLGSLNITNPGATVGETTPPVTWSMTGETQERYRVTLYRLDVATGARTQQWTVMATGTASSVTLPSGHIVTGGTYVVRVETWDTENRYADDHLTDEQQFFYVRDGTPADVSTLAATPVSDSAAVLLQWTRASAPDFFSLRVDGVEVMDRIDPADVTVSPGVYQMTYWGATPRKSQTYEIEAVVQASPGTPFQHSNNNPVRTAKTNPLGIWLADPTDGRAVMIEGLEDNPPTIGESGTTFYTVGGQSPVRIVDATRGYEGVISGTLASAAARDDFHELRSRRAELRLVIGDLSFPVQLEAGEAVPTPVPGDRAYAISFGYFQCGPPWPVRPPA